MVESLVQNSKKFKKKLFRSHIWFADMPKYVYSGTVWKGKRYESQKSQNAEKDIQKLAK